MKQNETNETEKAPWYIQLNKVGKQNYHIRLKLQKHQSTCNHFKDGGST